MLVFGENLAVGLEVGAVELASDVAISRTIHNMESTKIKVIVRCGLPNNVLRSLAALIAIV